MLTTMKEILADAEAGGYAAGYFNTLNLEMMRAVVETAEELRSPVIVGTAERLLSVTEMREAGNSLLGLARNASVPVGVHFDHAYSFDRCIEAVRTGFTSVMLDASKLPYEDNIAAMQEIVKVCHAVGVSVEGELGHVGPAEEGTRSSYFTDPDKAAEYVEKTGIDALAVAVGNAHGEYKFTPELDFQRIEDIRGTAGVPLVLHGGSGLTDDDFLEAIRRGIRKVNIYTEINKAGKAGLEKGFRQGAANMAQLIPFEIDAMKDVVREKLLLFGSAGKA